jgi:Ca-activated chloride channel homolog
VKLLRSDGNLAVWACLLLCLGWMLAAAARGQAPVITAEVRWVEVYATVTDRNGRYVAGLSRDQFEVRDNGELQPIQAFEAVSSDLACAVLLDATGSMKASLQTVKKAVVRLIEHLRANDSVALYTFNTSLSLPLEFTHDKLAAKKAVMAVQAAGATAWFDAVARIAMDLTRRKGKKGVVAFTDGGENASFLNASASIMRARIAGIPIYTIAQGDALRNPALEKQIKQISEGTGGRSHAVRNPSDLDEVFMKIAQDLQHTYMLAYPAPPSNDARWRVIQLAVKDRKDVRIRAKEGYFPK